MIRRNFKSTYSQSPSSIFSSGFRNVKNLTRIHRALHPACLMPDNFSQGSGSSSSLSVGKRNISELNKILKKKEKAEESCNDINEEGGSSDINQEPQDSSWQSWLDYFFEMDNLFYDRQCLAEDLTRAIADEEYNEATRIKNDLEEIENKNIIKKAEKRLLDMIKEEQFEDAARLRDEGLFGLRGWWVARCLNDPCGFLVHFEQGLSKYKGKAYSTKDIAKANGWTDQSLSTLGNVSEVSLEELGRPSLEVFLREDTTGKIQHQACALQVPKMNSNDIELSLSEIADDILIESEKDEKGNLVKMTFTVVNTDDDDDEQEEQEEEGDEEEEEEEEEEDEDEDEEDMSDSDEEEISLINDDDSDSDPIIIHVEDDSDDEISRDKFDEFQKSVMDVLEMNYRLPADIKWWDRDHFVVNVHEEIIENNIDSEKEDSSNDQNDIRNSEDYSPANDDILGTITEKKNEEKTISVRRASSAKSLASAIKNIRQKSLEPDSDESYLPQIAEFIKLAQKKQSKLSLKGEIMFSRVPSGFVNTDPFSGLFMGAFGPHGPELLYLTRQKDPKTGDEYVEGRKLTGDPNVPAGEASFRVKIGRKCRLNTRGIYPEELGIKARYKGLGRVAEHGFQDPRWVEGELLQFAPGSNSMLTGGAELGFVWAVPGSRRFLILLNRLSFPEL